MSAEIPAKPARVDWLSILQFSFGALGILVAWGLALITGIGNAGSSSLVLRAGVFVVGTLLLPSTLLAVQRLRGQTSGPFIWRGKRFGAAIFLFPILLVLGTWTLDADQLTLALPIYLGVTGLLVAWLLWIGLRDLRPGSAQRAFGAFGAGLVATPLLALTLELIAGFALVVVLAIYANTNPELVKIIEQLLSPSGPETVVLTPLVKDPVVLGVVLFGLGIVGPFIEELLKPLGVYLLLRRKLTEEQGFALGALSGAGYALFENLALNASPDTLFIGAIGRFGASALHIATAALSGWALARAVQQKRFLPLAGILGLNILIHGIWNSLIVLLATGTIAGDSALAAFNCISPVGLLILVIVSVVVLRQYNRRFNPPDSLIKVPQPDLTSL